MATVLLYLYDLSEGWCKNLRPLCPVSVLWHTSIVIYGKEYVFGANGIKFHNPGTPLEIVELGTTNMTQYEFKIYIKGLKYSDFSASSYDLLDHNCNHFTDFVAQNLGFGSIPAYVFESAEKLLKSPFCGKVVDYIKKNSLQK